MIRLEPEEAILSLDSRTSDEVVFHMYLVEIRKRELVIDKGIRLYDLRGSDS